MSNEQLVFYWWEHIHIDLSEVVSGGAIATKMFFAPPLFTVKAPRNNAEFVLDNISDFHNILQCYLQGGTSRSYTDPIY